MEMPHYDMEMPPPGVSDTILIFCYQIVIFIRKFLILKVSRHDSLSACN